MKPKDNLEQRLKAAKPTGAAPAGLHDCIIGAVRAAGESPQDVPSGARRGWRFATIVAVTAGLLGLGIRLSLPRPEPMTGVAPVLETSHTLVATTPAIVFNPLATELDLVNRDVRFAVEHLVASIP